MPATGATALRVLVVTKRLDVGGTERHIARTLPAVASHGIDASLFVLERGGALEADLEGGGIRIAGPAASPSRTGGLARAAASLRFEMIRFKPDIVHFFLPEPYIVGRLVAFTATAPATVMSRRSLAHYQGKHPILGRLERWLHRHTRALIANSAAVASELVSECGEPAKVGTIHNGIALPSLPTAEERQALRTRFGLPADALVLMIVANLIPYKGHADLIDALALAAPRLGLNWRLVIVGRDAGIGAELKRRAGAAGIDDSLLWLGEQPSADALFAAADIAVLASHEEGFSNALIEAMGRRLPAIATTVGGNADAIADGVSGLLVPPRAPAELAAAILRLASDAELRTRLGDAARRRVEREFSLEAAALRHANLYAGLRAGIRAPVERLIELGAPAGP